ncbi:MAG TPA: maleate cis-trans isomerase [Pseudonocardiaceae bacterium]
MATIGFLYPGHAAEDDYPRIEQMLGGAHRLVVEHTYGEDLHAVDALLALGSEDKLAEGAGRLAQYNPDVVLWACTSGSFVFGWEGAEDQARKLSAAAGVPASSTSFAFVHAAHALGVRRVAVAASYPDEVAQRFVEFLGRGGLEVLSMSSADIVTAAEVGELPDDAVIELAVRNDNPDADALLIPDTAMRTVGLVARLEQRLGKPVLTANQVTVWEGLVLASAPVVCPAAGALFSEDTRVRSR